MMTRESIRELADALAAGRQDAGGATAADVKGLATELVSVLEGVEAQRDALARLQSEIERTRQRSRELFERAPVAYLLLDADGVIEDVNEAAQQLLGWRRSEACNHEFAWFVAPPRTAVWQSALAAALEGARPTCDLEVSRGDGALLPARVSPVCLSRSGDVRLLVTVSDSSDRLEAARALRRSESNYRELFDANPVPMLIATHDGRVTLAANPAAERAFRLRGAELRARSLLSLASDGDAVALVAWLRDGRREQREQTLRFRRGADGCMVAQVSAHDVTFDGVEAALVVFEDITEHWHAERETRRANELLRAVINAAPMGIVCVGPHGEVRIANAAADRILGAHVSARPGEAFVELARVEGLASIVLRALEGSEVPPTDLRSYLDSRDAAEPLALRTRHLTLTAAPLVSDEGRVEGAIVAVTDVTRRRELEDQIRQSDKLRAIGQLASGIAHDFNNMLTVIMTCASSIQEHLADDHPVAPEARDALSTTHRAASLTHRLLAFSRRQSGDSAEANVDVVVRDWSESILKHWIPESIRLDVRLEAGDACVALDPAQLTQVLLNLVLNARDALEGSGTIELRTSLDATVEPPRVQLEVVDDGVGMEPHVLERIFEPFYTTKGPEAGTGLGLATVYGIVQQSNGEILVDSVPGRGSRFCIRMPCTERVSRPTAPPPRMSLEPGNECVLLVEDDESVRRSLRRGLVRMGFRVLDAEGVERALELARMYRDTIRVLVTDVVMPVANGFEVAREVSRIVPGVGVIFMSGYADDAILPLGAANEIGPILAKPFTPDHLAVRIREAARRGPQSGAFG